MIVASKLFCTGAPKLIRPPLTVFGYFWLKQSGNPEPWPEMSTDQDWIGLEPIFAGLGLDRTAFFFKIGGPGLDRTEKILVVIM